MRTILASLALVLSSLVPVAAAEQDTVAAQYISAWVIAHDHADVAALTALYAEDAVLLPPGEANPLQGTARIKPYFEALLRSPAPNLTMTLTMTRQIGDLVYAAGQWQEGLADKPVGGLFLFILMHRDSGWTAEADTWNLVH